MAWLLNYSPYFDSVSLVIWPLSLTKSTHFSELSISRFSTYMRKAITYQDKRLSLKLSRLCLTINNDRIWLLWNNGGSSFKINAGFFKISDYHTSGRFERRAFLMNVENNRKYQYYLNCRRTEKLNMFPELKLFLGGCFASWTSASEVVNSSKCYFFSGEMCFGNVTSSNSNSIICLRRFGSALV